MSRIIASVYRSSKKDGMYLYVEKAKELSRVPAALLEMFGRAELAMTLLLSEDKPLARVDVKRVMQEVQGQGFFLQMPPAECEEMTDLAIKNTKLPR